MKAREAGQGLVEYALILVLVAVVVLVVQNLLGSAIGNIFSESVLADLGTPLTTAFGDGGLGTLAGSTNCPEAEREARETLLALGEEFGQQDEGVDESAILLREAAGEMLEVLTEHAAEIGDEAFLEQLQTLQQEVESGNYGAIVDVLPDLGSRLAAIAGDVQIAAILKAEPLLIDACWALADAPVSLETFDGAMQALMQLEEDCPGSTGDAIPAMNEIRDLVEERNLIIGESTSAIAVGIDTGIAKLVSTGDEALLDRALEFEAQSEGCGS